MKSVKFSIIIPVYNGQDYIQRCLDSIVCQSFNDYEIVVVDDESKDDTNKIVKKYVNKYKQIKLFNKKNGGVSDARNYGLSKASGEYVMFVDSDDYLNDDKVLETLNNNIKGVDVIRFGHKSVINNKVSIVDIDLNEIYESGLDFIDDCLSKNNGYGWYLWQYAFKRKLWKDISFPIGKIFEDTFTIYKVLLKANKIKVINKPMYVYSYNDISLSKKINLKICKDMLEINSSVIKDVENKDIPIKTKKLLQNNFSYGYISVINALNYLNNDDKKVIRTQLDKYKYMLDYCIYGKAKYISLFIKVFSIRSMQFLLNIRRIIKNK